MIIIIIITRNSVYHILLYFQGLEAAEDLSCDRPLIEYKGKVMLREQYDKENVFFKQYVLISFHLVNVNQILILRRYIKAQLVNTAVN